jgi:DNA-binding transcriptional MocR family regulator
VSLSIPAEPSDAIATDKVAYSVYYLFPNNHNPTGITQLLHRR